MSKKRRSPSRQYFGYHQYGDYDSMHRCCYKRHHSWQAARDHAESQAFAGATIHVYEWYMGASRKVYEAQKERG